MTEQRTEAWHAEKLGNLSASRVYDIIPGSRGAYPAAREHLLYELLAERITGTRVEKYVTAAMQWGIDMEPVARDTYSLGMGVDVEETGFHLHPKIPRLGASPDGLVPDNGLVEIKCPSTSNTLKLWAGEDIDPRYNFQMQTQMSVTGREWCDFVSFDLRLPRPLDLFVKRIKRDRFVIELIEHEARKFLEELHNLEKTILEKMNG